LLSAQDFLLNQPAVLALIAVGVATFGANLQFAFGPGDQPGRHLRPVGTEY
jgi:hypothetical protein